MIEVRGKNEIGLPFGKLLKIALFVDVALVGDPDPDPGPGSRGDRYALGDLRIFDLL